MANEGYHNIKTMHSSNLNRDLRDPARHPTIPVLSVYNDPENIAQDTSDFGVQQELP